MPPTIDIADSEFRIQNLTTLRGDPKIEFAHRLKTGAHLKYLDDRKLFDVTKSEWAKKTVNGEVVYAHEYEGCVLTVRLKTADGKLHLAHNEDGAFDRHLMANPGEKTVYSITSTNNGLQSTYTLTAVAAGLSTVGLVVAALAFTVSLSNGLGTLAAAVAAAAVGTAVNAPLLTITVSGTGVALALLAFIGIWIAFGTAREIAINLIYENRSSKTLALVDHYVYNIGDNKISSANLGPREVVDPVEYYSDVVVAVDNYSKYKGIGVSMKFQKPDGSYLAICIRNDIYHQPHYTIQAFPKDDKTSAENVYNNCSGDLTTNDFQWGNDIIVKNNIDPQGFKNYNFAGIISFHDKA